MLKNLAAAEGILKPGEVALLRRVLDTTLPEGSTQLERDFRATTLLNLFKGGMRTEAELIAAITGQPTDRAA
ncbi:MAG: hypothetical protein EOR16_16585 [Mesorhizobium sp.]|uniref:hypothetical protein n=1 Tax=Mesorhizobium sp. TaxID=1871066 RepID=UPI000FE8E1AD|nr:hypothetical protein [Mesorhizobium sp.]RWI57184.1 MAG: hypothetical protein EOR16_16585 [Mesorhizobium sp.]